MAETSRPWDGNILGDVEAAGYTSLQWRAMFRAFFGPNRATEGVLRDSLSELAVSGVASPVFVAAGNAVVDGTFYESTGGENLIVPTPSAGNCRIDRVILRQDVSLQTVRLALLAGSESPAPSPPALTQVSGTLWEISLAQVEVTEFGLITVTDERDFVGLHDLPLHAADHSENAGDEILVEALGTASVVAGEVPTADGTGGLTMLPQSGGIGLESSVKSGSRTAAAGSGTVSITGAGFAPKAAIVWASEPNAAFSQRASWGFIDENDIEGRIRRGDAGNTFNTSGDFINLSDGVNAMTAVGVLTSDGIDITFTKIGTGFDVEFQVILLGGTGGASGDHTGETVTLDNIQFPAVPVPSADPNNQDTYEEGTFTPAIADNDSDGSGEGQTYSVQAGFYTKIGNRVIINGTVTVTSIGTLTGVNAVRMVGLPFVHSSGGGDTSAITVNPAAGLNLPGAFGLTGFVVSGVTYMLMNIEENTAGGNSLLVSEFSGSGSINFGGVYHA